MSSMDGGLQISTNRMGKEVAGKLFRPYAFETVGAVSLEVSGLFIAITLYPTAADPEFKEPVVIMLADENVENFIKAIRIAQAGLGAVRKGGSS